MRWFAPCRFVHTVVVAGLLTAPCEMEGQTRITVSGGPAEYDLSGTGWSGTAAVHFERSAKAWLRVEGGAGFFWYRTQGDQGVVMLLPEVGVAIQAPSPFPIYLSAGAGRSLGVSGGQPDDEMLYTGLGLSLAASDRWTVRPEVRIRFVGPTTGGIGSFTIGINRSFGR